MEKNRKLGLALIAAGCALAVFCGIGLYYVNCYTGTVSHG